ncbi:MAG TPA: hypothetical protein VMV59_04175, partial [Candidatus Dormibacteraeota bacterium]|nr:hypothetical protein [Candidatus Dormibacteraeota bacterium]
MLGPLDYVLVLVSFVAEVYVVARLCISKNSLRYLSLNIYMLATVGVTVGQAIVWNRFGVSSPV